MKRDSVRIRGYSAAGVFYGVQTLRQLLPPDILRRSPVDEMRWTVPVVEIEDTPRFSWRGAHMDVARHFMPKEFILKFLDLMALHKLNVFHWHLVDDEGWRVEIKKYPRLTSVGGLTDYTTFNPVQPMQLVSLPQGGYYTQDDVREVVRYASERFITVLPEIEMPGHSSAAIASYPELGNRIEIAQSGGDPSALGSRDSVLNVEDPTVHFMQDVLSEVLTLFPSKFIHIGGDEVEKRPWQANPRAQQRMRQLGLKNEEELQSWFIRQMDNFLTSRGRRLVGWDEILEGGIAAGATVMSWRGVEGGIAAARAGHDVIMRLRNSPISITTSGPWPAPSRARSADSCRSKRCTASTLSRRISARNPRSTCLARNHNSGRNGFRNGRKWSTWRFQGSAHLRRWSGRRKWRGILPIFRIAWPPM